MEVGKLIYDIRANVVSTITEIKPLIGGFNYIIEINGYKKSLLRDEFLTLEQCADIFANKELEQLILNYKK